MDIVGHDFQRRTLARLLRTGRLPSTLLFHGAPGVGKALVARELARSLFCDGRGEPYGGCGGCRSCSLFDSGNLPDFYRMDVADKEEWNVAKVRELLYSLNLKSFLASSRVVLMENSEHLSVQAANALLKSLEEPRPDTYYVLVTANPSRIPRTVLSRCHPFFFDGLAVDELKIILSRSEASRSSSLPVGEQAVLADGSLEHLSALLGAGDEWDEMKTKLRLIAAGRISVGVEFARELGKDKEKLRVRLGLMRTMARNSMKEATKGSERARWATCLANVITAERLVFDRNLAAGIVLNALFLALAGSPGEFAVYTNDDSLLSRAAVR